MEPQKASSFYPWRSDVVGYLVIAVWIGIVTETHLIAINNQ